MKVFKATTDKGTDSFSIKVVAKTYKDAESKALEKFVKRGILPAGGFFLLQQVTCKRS